jgi:hypothetical protein
MEVIKSIKKYPPRCKLQILSVVGGEVCLRMMQEDQLIAGWFDYNMLRKLMNQEEKSRPKINNE